MPVPRRCLLLLLALLGARTEALRGQSTDSLRRSRPPIIRGREALEIGGAVIVAGLLDPDVRNLFQTERTVTTNDAATVGNSFGHALTVGPALAATWLLGTIAGKPKVANAALWAAGAGAAAGVATAGLKFAFGRSRPPKNLTYDFHPFSTKDHSFPSGHTSFAFAIASSLAHATPDHWSDVLFYAGATLTGLSRINDDKHWLSDVVAGAALGVLVGRQLTSGRQGGRAAGVSGLRPMIGVGVVGFSGQF